MLQQVANPFQGRLPGTPFNGATVPLQQLVRPFPQFAGITEDRRQLGVNDYDSLQFSLNKRMSKGLQFLVSYTFSRTEEEVAYLNTQDDWDQLTRVVTAADSPHRLLSAAPGSCRSSAAGGRARSALGGWQMNGIVTFQSGLPVAHDGRRVPGRRSDARQSDAGALVQHLHAGAERRAPELRDGGRADRLAGPAAVHAAHAADALRRRPDQAPRRWSTSRCSRRSTLPARMRLQVRLESFNLFNTPWFGAPNTNVTNAAFGTVAPTQANDPRNIQIGIRLMF